MRTPAAAAVVLLLALALTPSPAEAHIDSFSEADTVTVGPYSVFLDPRPYPIFEGSSVSMSALVTDKSTGRYARDVGIVVNVTAPSGATRSAVLRPDQTGYLVGTLLVDEAGNHTARIILNTPNGTHAGVTWFDTYPDLAVRIRPSDADFDAYANRTATLSFEVVDSRRYTPDTTLTDLTVRLEHWSDDHKTLHGAAEVPLEQGPGGLWRADYTFPSTGMFHMRFASASGNFTYEDVPLLHVYAIEAPEPEEPRSTSAPSAALAVGVLATAALLASASRRRRG